MADDAVQVRFGADTSGLSSGVDEAKDKLGEVGNSAEGLGEVFGQLQERIAAAFAADKIIEFVKGTLEAADSLYIFSQRTGIAASTLSALNIPLIQNGSSVEEFSSSMRFMSRNIEQASEGNQTLIKRFDDLGLSVTKLKSLSPEEQFFSIAQALGGVSDQARFTNDLIGIFGRGAQGLGPIIKETAGNLKDMADQIKAAGGALTDEEVKRVHEWDDAWISAWEHFKIGVVDAAEGWGLLWDKINSTNKNIVIGVNGSISAAPNVEPSTQTPPGFLSDQQAAKTFASTAAPNPAAGNNSDLQAGDSSQAAEQEAQAEAQAELQIERDKISTQLEIDKIGLQQQKDVDAEAVAAGKMSKAQEIQDLQAFAALEYQENMEALDRQAKLYDEDSVEYQQALDKKEVLTAQFNAEMAKLGAQQAEQQQKDNAATMASFKTFTSTVGTDFDQMIQGVMQGTQTWQQALARAFTDMEIAFVEAVAKMIAQWLFFEAVTAGAGLLGIGGATSALGLTAGPLGKLVGSFDTGTDYVPQTGLAMIHQGEMIIPASQAAQIRSGGGSGGDSYNVQISAVDAQSFVNLLQTPQGQKAIVNVVSQQTRNLNSKLKP